MRPQDLSRWLLAAARTDQSVRIIPTRYIPRYRATCPRFSLSGGIRFRNSVSHIVVSHNDSVSHAVSHADCPDTGRHLTPHQRRVLKFAVTADAHEIFLRRAAESDIGGRFMSDRFIGGDPFSHGGLDRPERTAPRPRHPPLPAGLDRSQALMARWPSICCAAVANGPYVFYVTSYVLDYKRYH